MQPNKACPVLLRPGAEAGASALEILAFRHPLAGRQLIKGTIEPSEAPVAAALRELQEESGIADAHVARNLGLWRAGVHGQIWACFLCLPATPPPDQWAYFTTDGGGHLFEFFWQPIDQPLDEQWHPVFVGAVNYIRQALRLFAIDAETVEKVARK